MLWFCRRVIINLQNELSKQFIEALFWRTRELDKQMVESILPRLYLLYAIIILLLTPILRYAQLATMAPLTQNSAI